MLKMCFAATKANPNYSIPSALTLFPSVCCALICEKGDGNRVNKHLIMTIRQKLMSNHKCK